MTVFRAISMTVAVACGLAVTPGAVAAADPKPDPLVVEYGDPVPSAFKVKMKANPVEERIAAFVCSPRRAKYSKAWYRRFSEANEVTYQIYKFTTDPATGKPFNIYRIIRKELVKSPEYNLKFLNWLCASHEVKYADAIVAKMNVFKAGMIESIRGEADVKAFFMKKAEALLKICREERAGTLT